MKIVDKIPETHLCLLSYLDVIECPKNVGCEDCWNGSKIKSKPMKNYYTVKLTKHKGVISSNSIIGYCDYSKEPGVFIQSLFKTIMALREKQELEITLKEVK